MINPIISPRTRIVQQQQQQRCTPDEMGYDRQVALDNLKPRGTLVVVLNITPHLTHLATLCFLRTVFRRIVATKPVSCFKYHLRDIDHVMATTAILD
eukprot:COSAG01_NODE_12782_length_1686_cov_2.051670_1_plen_97_part_00